MEKSRTGKVEFETETQMYIDLTESTATVEYVIQEVKHRWGDDYVIVTIDGLELGESEGTKGMDCLYIFKCTFATQALLSE